MSNFLTKITELFRYTKTYKLSTVTLKTPIIDFSFAPSTILQPSYEGCFFILFSHVAGAPSDRPAALTRRIPCCSFLSRSGISHSKVEPLGSCS